MHIPSILGIIASQVSVQDGSVDDWILATSDWNDLGVWYDTDVWID